MWLLRKLYAGNGAVLPPNDPRILSMTDAQMEIEFEHFAIDAEARAKAAKGEEQFEDDEYENYDKETDETDNRLFWEEPKQSEGSASEKHKVTTNLPKSEKTNEGEWVDVEIDDDDEDYD
jgi:hypothetical protein